MNPPLVSAAGVKARLEAYGLAPNPALGQNFLIDPAARDAIVSALPASLPALEIGPGLGALTEGLLAGGRRVVAVEKDAAMVRALKVEFPALCCIEGDFLRADLAALHAALGGGAFAVAGNLPYYATSPIALLLLESDLPIEEMALMVQEEAAERFLAGPKSRVYGPLAVLSALRYEAEIVLRLTPASYWPAPDVHSAVVYLKRRPGAAIPAGFPAFLRGTFAMRRKTLLNNLLAIGWPKEEALAALASAGLRPDVRAEALEPGELLEVYSA